MALNGANGFSRAPGFEKSGREDLYPDDTLTLFRGVAGNSPAFGKACNGIAEPRGGHNRADWHNEGDTESKFMSWTLDWSVAHQYAAKAAPLSGAILTFECPVFRTVQSPDVFHQDEVLVTGTVIGAGVTFVGGPGH